MAVGTGNFGDLLWPGIRSIYGERYTQWKKLYPLIFDVMDSDKAFEKFQGVTGFGLFAVKDQGKAAAFADPFLGFQTIIDPVVYAMESAVTIEMFEDDQYNFINKIPTMLADSVNQTEETIAFNVLNRAFNTSFLGSDGKVLAATDHPLVNGAATFSNRPTVAADLSQTAIENGLIAISDLVDDTNKKINLKGLKLVCSTADQFTAEKVLKTEYKVDSADNTINPIHGRLMLLVSPYLTDPDAWFITTDSGDGLVFTRRRAPKMARENEFDTQSLKFLCTTRFGVGFVNPRCLYGSPGS